MYRKRSSILFIKSISPWFFQVIPSLNPSSPSSFPKYAVKTSPLIHSLWRRRFNVSAQRSDFLPDSDANGSYQQDPSGSDGGNPTNLQQNPTGWYADGHNDQNLRTSEDGVYSKISDFSTYSNPNRSYQQNPYGSDRGNLTNLQQSPVASPNCQFNQMNKENNLGANGDGIYRERSDFLPYLDSSGSYKQNPYGSDGRGSINLQQNPVGHPNAQFNHTYNYQNLEANERSDFPTYSSSNRFYQHNQVRKNKANLKQNPVGYPYGQSSQIYHAQNMEANVVGINRVGSDSSMYLNTNGSYQHKQFGDNPNHLQQKAVRYSDFPAQNSVSELWRDGSIIGDQFNQTSNGPSLGVNGDGVYGERSDFSCYSDCNGSYHQNHNGRNLVNKQQSLIGYRNDQVNQINRGQNLGTNEDYIHRKTSDFPRYLDLNGHHVPPLLSSEVVTYEDNLFKFDEFCKVGKVKEAIAVLAALEKIGMAIDIPRYLMLIESCGKEKCLEKAKLIHDHLEWTVREVDVRVHNKILDMYSKCGLMDDAYQLFEKMPQRNITSWETMISGLANNGLGEEAIDLFTQFKEMGLKPDGGLFTAVFYTCGVLGAVDQGMLYFNSMKVDYGIAPLMEHYISIVDMFGRSGHLDEALEFVEMMPIEPNIDVWETLMNFCWVNGYIELGDRCAEIVEQHDSTRLTEQAKKGLLPIKTLELIKENEIKQNCDELNVKHYMHEFIAGRPENNMLYEQLRCLAQQMKEAGYVPDLACTLHDVDPENREEALMYHSERLAIVHGLMTSPARRPIRVIKNLRVCRDCHAVMKIISKLTGRLIIARDTKRFHHVENGFCSCNDFW